MTGRGKGTRRDGSTGARAPRVLALAGVTAIAAFLVVGTGAVAGAQTTTEPSTEPSTTTVTDPPVSAAAVTSFTKAFAPSDIDPDGTSTLTFNIGVDADTAVNLTDTLPSGVVIASAPNVNQSAACLTPAVTATAGGSSITWSGTVLVATQPCVISVDVTAGNEGSYQNTAHATVGAVVSNAQATLLVTGPPIFTKSFDPQVIAAGGVSKLTILIDSSANPVDVTNLDITDTLENGLKLATPNNVATTCTGGSLNSPADGGTSIHYSGGTVGAGKTCTVTADVTATEIRAYPNVASMTSSQNDVAITATQELVVSPLVLTKTFVEGSIVSGGTASFNITAHNQGGEVLNNVVIDDPLATACNHTFPTLAANETQTYTCSLAGVTAGFTNTANATATTASGRTVTATASAAVTVTPAGTAATTTPSTPTLALTGGNTTLLTVIGFSVLALGAVLTILASPRRRLARR
jgi:hypothetical protein